MASQQKKEKRIDKEIFLLRNLPKEYKLGKKDTQLGTLIDVSNISIISFLFYSLKSTKVLLNLSFLTNRLSAFILTYCSETSTPSNHQS